MAELQDKLVVTSPSGAVWEASFDGGCLWVRKRRPGGEFGERWKASYIDILSLLELKIYNQARCPHEFNKENYCVKCKISKLDAMLESRDNAHRSVCR